MLELETLGPLTHIAASGGSAEHVERWTLARAKVGDTDESISQALLPLVEG
jgi:hypothetical protein